MLPVGCYGVARCCYGGCYGIAMALLGGARWLRWC